MSSQQAKVIAALNLALHPNTVDADIVAGVRGAYRLMDGKTVTDFLGLSASQQKLSEELAELRHALGVSEAKLEGAVEYCNELKLEIQRLEEELSKARNEQEKRQQEKKNKPLWWQIVVSAHQRKKPGVAQCFGSLICFMFGLGPSIGIGSFLLDRIYFFFTDSFFLGWSGFFVLWALACVILLCSVSISFLATLLKTELKRAIIIAVSLPFIFAIPVIFEVAVKPPAPPPAVAQTQPAAVEPTVTYTSQPGWTNEHGQPCREYTLSQGSVILGNGVACRGTDGLWRR